jgi:acetylornithine deacetylase/succinyl-diaminopimelate desuccinylase family protein
MRADGQWFHVTTHTYGAWLYGDPRGFRTRHHREHVEGDYKNPPKGEVAKEYAKKFERSKKSLKQPPVRLTPAFRAVVGAALRERLVHLGAEVIAVAMTARHAHILAKMPDAKKVTRHWVGLAKKHAWFLARDEEWTGQTKWTGQMWAKRSKATRVKDRQHHENAFDYIVAHKYKGAWLWTFRDPPPPPSPFFAKNGLGAANPPSQTTDRRQAPVAGAPQAQTHAPRAVRSPMLPLPQLLSKLVQLPSVNPMGRTDIHPDILYEHRVTAFLEEQLKGLGAEVRRQRVAEGRDNLTATYTPPTPAPFSVIFEAHQDTVPVDGMIVESFGGKVEGGRLWGRGSCDVKAGVAVMLAAFARLVREKPAGSAKVTVAFTVDEEHGGRGVTAAMEAGLRADYAIVAEPTLLNIVNAHKGVARWRIEVAGQACHSSRPDRGVNAVYRMARLVRGIEEYAKKLAEMPPDPVLGPRSCSVGVVQGGVSANTVPDFCRAEVDRRLVPGETYATATADLESHLRSLPDVDFPFTVTQASPGCTPLSPERSVELVKRFGAVIDSVVGKHTVHSVPFGTDAARVATAGVPAVVFGPGDIAQAHTKDEWIDLAQLEPAAEILFRFACGR